MSRMSNFKGVFLVMFSTFLRFFSLRCLFCPSCRDFSRGGSSSHAYITSSPFLFRQDPFINLVFVYDLL